MGIQLGLMLNKTYNLSLLIAVVLARSPAKFIYVHKPSGL